MSAYCGRCEILLVACPHGRDLAEPPPTPVVSHPFRARYDGRCQQDGCREPIRAGDLIRYIDDRVACGRCS